MTPTTYRNAVSQAYASQDSPLFVYGRYREQGYQVNPLINQIGTQIPEHVSAHQAFQSAGLEWIAEKRQNYFETSSGPVTSPKHCSIVRNDTEALLGVHGSGYTPVQNSAIVNLLNYLREDITIENVLSLRGGAKVFATASIRCEGEIIPGDTIRRYIHAFNSHDGSSSFGVFFSDIRLRCANQLSYITGKHFKNEETKGNGLRMKHTSSVTTFAEKLPQLIDLQRRTFDQNLSELRELTKLTLTPELARRILETTYADKLAKPIRERGCTTTRPRELHDLPEIDKIRSHFSGVTGYGIKEPGIAGTAYGLFNAITQYETHDAGRAKDDTERARTRLEALWGGTSARRIDTARQAALALI